MLNDVDEAEIERRLLNWANWHSGGARDGSFVDGGGSDGVSSIYTKGERTGGRTGYRVASVPMLALDAQQTDRAVRSLPLELADALTAWYRRRGPPPDYQRFDVSWTQERIAGALGVSRTTLHRRIVEARERVHEALRDGVGRRQ